MLPAVADSNFSIEPLHSSGYGTLLQDDLDGDAVLDTARTMKEGLPHVVEVPKRPTAVSTRTQT